jgi:hypothetical protein
MGVVAETCEIAPFPTRTSRFVTQRSSVHYKIAQVIGTSFMQRLVGRRGWQYVADAYGVLQGVIRVSCR